jgi:peptidoglycan/xylan/chitin deacetylase (PgdA/CDA1 family)
MNSECGVTVTDQDKAGKGAQRLIRSSLPVIALLVTIAAGAETREEIDSGADAPIRQMAITVDDLPASRSHALTFAQQEYVTRRVVGTLFRHGVPAVGFVNESKLEVDGRVDPARVALLEQWLESGLELGNHGYAHLDLHRAGAEQWLADVLRGERVVRPLVEARGEKLRWFRHPFLHAGRSAAVQEQVAGFLAEHGYRVAPVTIDNSEWIYAREYTEALERGDEAGARRLGEDYLRYMLDVVAFYEQQARDILDRPLPHVLLIHANLLNADWLDELLKRLEGIGYTWMPLEQALEDPAYARPISGYTGAGGITWLHRWAITEGMDTAVFRGEPRVPGWVERGAAAQEQLSTEE